MHLMEREWLKSDMNKKSLNSAHWTLLGFYQTLTLTLIQPASKWMHWATVRHHPDLFRAATSASSQVIPILNKSLLTVLLQLVRRSGTDKNATRTSLI